MLVHRLFFNESECLVSSVDKQSIDYCNTEFFFYKHVDIFRCICFYMLSHKPVLECSQPVRHITQKNKYLPYSSLCEKVP